MKVISSGSASETQHGGHPGYGPKSAFQDGSGECVRTTVIPASNLPSVLSLIITAQLPFN